MATKYHVDVSLGDGLGDGTISFFASSNKKAKEDVTELIKDWVYGGSWPEYAEVYGKYELYKTTTDTLIDEGEVTVTIEPDEDDLIKEATKYVDDDEDHDHEFTSDEDEVEHPVVAHLGTWGHGGTAMTIRTQCRYCGLVREVDYRGSQRNRGETESEVKYYIIDDNE